MVPAGGGVHVPMSQGSATHTRCIRICENRIRFTTASVMSQSQLTDVTRLLSALRAGDSQAEEQLFPIVYDELRRAAARMLAGERVGHTFNPSDLVHEAWMRLGLHGDDGPAALPATDRAHFLGLTIRAMRHVLIDHARRRLAEKRGAGARRVTLDDGVEGAESSPEELLGLFDALERLGAIDMRLRQVVEYRYLAGFTEEETAQCLHVTTRTVQRDWVKARAWLYRQLYSAETVS
jgi:RNA polymerase sigma factor (TIGR02999 family)